MGRCPLCGGELPVEYKWFPESGILVGNGKAVTMSPQSAAIFDLLWKARDKLDPVKTDTILSRVYGGNSSGGPNTAEASIRVQMHHLRNLLKTVGLTISRTKYRLIAYDRSRPRCD